MIVSTDDPETVRIALAAGAEVPFFRPRKLAGDHVGLKPVLGHFVEWLESQNIRPEYLACVYATAAFLRPQDLKTAFKTLRAQKTADFIISVSSYNVPPFQAIVQNSKNRLRYLWLKFSKKRTQDLRPTFYDAGQFMIGRTRRFLRFSSILEGHAIPYILPKSSCLDIDTLEDWKLAEALFADFKK